MSCRWVQSIDKKKKKRDRTENSIFTLILFIWKQFHNVRPKCTCMFPHLVFWFFLCVLLSVCNHSEAVMECESTSCPSRQNTVPWWILQPEAPLFAIRVFLVLAELAQSLCGWFWKRSRATVAGRGLFPTTHVAAIKRRKGPCSREQCYCLLEILQSRCHSVWIHFHLVVKKRKKKTSRKRSQYITSTFQAVYNGTEWCFSQILPWTWHWSLCLTKH